MTTELHRRARRTATFVAVPAAIAVGAVSLWSFGAFNEAPPASAPTTSAVPAASSPVSVPAPPLTPAAAAVCRAVIAKLPDQILDARRRPVTTGAEQNAAYGAPPIVLACGAGQPSVPPTAQVNPLNGVCWYGQPGPSGTVWTTVDRVVPISVTVPGGSEGSGQKVISFSTVIAAADPVAATKPTGCG